MSDASLIRILRFGRFGVLGMDVMERNLPVRVLTEHRMMEPAGSIRRAGDLVVGQALASLLVTFEVLMQEMPQPEKRPDDRHRKSDLL